MMRKRLNELLETEDGTKEMIRQCLNVGKKSEKIIIFGAGVGAGILLNLLKKNNLGDKVVAFSDNNHLKFNKTYMSEKLYVTPPAELMERYGENCTLIIASSAFDLIKKQLISYRYSEENIYLFNFAFMDLENTDKEFIWSHIDDFKRAYARMQDEKSRQIFVDILNYKITKKDTYLYHMQRYVDDERRQYFPSDLFEFSKDEVFLDLGAYTGDTLAAFDDAYHGQWTKYLGFEVDICIFSELRKCISKHEKKDKIEIYNLAAYNRKTTLYFSENAGSSSMAEEDKQGKIAVKADMLDNVLQNRKVTFIKMDIEGAEFNAISGMKNIIKNNIPIVAMCVYHRRDDIYKLTDLLEEISPSQYMFYLRQYRFTPTETVCYAIPKARLL